MSTLKQYLIRLGHQMPQLRDDIRPVLHRIDEQEQARQPLPQQAPAGRGYAGGSRYASQNRQASRNLFKEIIDYKAFRTLLRDTDDPAVKSVLRDTMQYFSDRLSLEGSEEMAFNRLTNIIGGSFRDPMHLRNQAMKIANLLGLDQGGLEYMSSQQKKAGLTQQDLKEFDLADFEEEELQTLIGKLNAVNNVRGAIEAFRHVAKADPGLFDIEVDQFDTTTNQVVSINAGDVYAPTLVFDEGIGSVEVMTFGDAVEAYERAYYKQNFMDGVEAAEVMIEFSLPLAEENKDQQIEKLERMFDSEISHGQLKIEFGPENVEYNKDFDSLALGGWMVSDSGYVQDFIQNVGAGHGNVSSFNQGIQDVLEEDLERFLRATLKNHGFNPEEVLHTVITDVDEPEKVDKPDYHHI